MKEYTYQWNSDWADDESKPILKITKSSLGTFNWCPKKYEYNYIQKLPQDQTEVMIKGNIIHNSREEFFNKFDVEEAKEMTPDELLMYSTTLHPIDEYHDVYEVMAAFETQRFLESKEQDTLDNFLPVGNEVTLDAEIVVPRNVSKKYPLLRDYTVHLQGIIDRVFKEGSFYMPMELKTGGWKDGKRTDMRKEMAYYKLLYESSTDEELISKGLDPNIDFKYWAWYYPVSNHLTVEPCKKRSTTAVWDSIAKLINAYESGLFATKFYAPTCGQYCSYFGICEGVTDNWL